MKRTLGQLIASARTFVYEQNRIHRNPEARLLGVTRSQVMQWEQGPGFTLRSYGVSRRPATAAVGQAPATTHGLPMSWDRFSSHEWR